MSCFSCINPHRKDIKTDIENGPRSSSRYSSDSSGCGKGGTIFDGNNQNEKVNDNGLNSQNNTNKARSFTYLELATATRTFREANLLGEGGFGKVFKGHLETGETVAVKQLNLDGLQGFQEFIVEVLMLSLLHHPNLVTLIGYCTSGNQRLLVYEYMPKGNLEEHLFDLEPKQTPISWNTRMKIAIGAARGLEYLHCTADPPVIYRDLKSANILLDSNFNPKLSDFGLAKLGPVGENTHVSTRVMGTYGYCAPEYAMSGKLTLKSDIYSFGVVLLELITGRKAIDHSRLPGEQNLVAWSRPFLKDRRRFCQLSDPALEGHYSRRCLEYAVAIAAMCLNEEANFRPLIGEIVDALEYVIAHSQGRGSNNVRVPGANISSIQSSPLSDKGSVYPPEPESRSTASV